MAGYEGGGGFGALAARLCPAVDVPLKLFATGRQVALIIGKGGALIKELREESGCVINILDEQLPLAFKNRDERVVLVRGKAEGLRCAVGGIVRLAVNWGGSAGGDNMELGDRQRSMEMMIPEISCSHLIGERGQRIAALMDETRCDLHVVRDPVSGLSEQKRLRITGTALADVQLAITKVHETMVDLVRTGVFPEDAFSMREGATAPVDLVPRAPRGTGGSSVSISVLLRKEETAWVIGKKGSKISKLREAARVSINDAAAPPFPPGNAILEISGAPLREQVEVLRSVITDLAVRVEATSVTRIIVSEEHIWLVTGNDGEKLAEISESSGGCVTRSDGGPFNGVHVLEVDGDEGARVAAVADIFGAIECAIDGRPTEAASLPSRPLSVAPPLPLEHGRPPSAQRPQRPLEDPAPSGLSTPAAVQRPMPTREALWSGDSTRDPALHTPPVEVTLAPAFVPASKEKVAPTPRTGTHALTSESYRQANGDVQTLHAGAVDDQRGERTHACAPHFVERAASRPTAYHVDAVQPTQAKLDAVGAPQVFADGTISVFLVLPSAAAAGCLASSSRSIACRTYTELTLGAGPAGEQMLRVTGVPAANAAACYLVQEALWLSGAYTCW